MDFKGLVVVTGASSGIGAKTAEIFSKEGHPLLLLARRLEKLEALGLPQTICRKTDITDEHAVSEAITEASREFGPVECLVNNAGVMLLGEADRQPWSEWQKMIDTNLTGMLRVTQAVLPQMISRRRGTIINISSLAGKKSFPNHAVYCATKYAVQGLTESLREELAPSGVRVTTICPGAVETDLLSHTSSALIKDNYQSWKESIGGAIQAETIAQAIWFAFHQPPSVCIREIDLAATGQVQ